MKFQRLLCIGTALVSIFACTAAVSAQDVELSEDTEVSLAAESTTISCGITYSLSDSGYATVTRISSTHIYPGSTATSGVAQGTVTIPAVVNNYPVVAIADGVGSDLTSVKVLDLSKATNLKTIGENCFSYCPNLTTVTFRTSPVIDSIGSNAFYYCPKLTTVSNLDKQTAITKVGTSVFGLTPFMDTQTADFVKIGKTLVKYNGEATAVTIPTGITYISDAFFGKDIVSVSLGSVTEIGSNAFYGCKSLSEVDLANVTSVGDMAFSGCTALKSVKYGAKLTSIGFCSFANCTSLSEFKYTGTGASKLTAIGECAFWNDRCLYYLDTGTIKNVNVGTFWNCFGDSPEEIGKVEYFRIPSTVTAIAEGGYGNLGFKFVTVPETLSAIASTAFGSVSNDAIYVVPKGSNAEAYFENSSYKKINYGDMNANGKASASDLVTVVGYVAKNLSELLKDNITPAEKDVLNYEGGKGVLADIDSDGIISTTDLHKIFQSFKEEYLAEKAESAEQ